jgi:hypothetical protein
VGANRLDAFIVKVPSHLLAQGTPPPAGPTLPTPPAVPSPGSGTGGTFSDNFDRPDSTVIGPRWQEVAGDLTVSGGELRHAAAKGAHVAVVSDLSGATQTASARFASSNNTASPGFGLVLRFQDAGNHYRAYRVTGATNAVRISRFANGTEKILASATLAKPAVDSFFVLSARADSSTITLDVDGARKLTVTDGTFATGRPGILLSTGSATATAARADDFSAQVQ